MEPALCLEKTREKIRRKEMRLKLKTYPFIRNYIPEGFTVRTIHMSVMAGIYPSKTRGCCLSPNLRMMFTREKLT